METIFKSVSLGFLLRSVFAGTFFVLTYGVATKNTCAAIHVHADNIFSFALAFALVAGVTIYGIHRAAVYPWFEWAIDAEWAKRWRTHRRRRLISNNVIRDLVNRWDNKAEKSDRHCRMRHRGEQITVWADFAHLQYVSALCIALGSLTGKIVGHAHYIEHRCWFVSIALFFALSATASAWRMRSVEEYWAEPSTF